MSLFSDLNAATRALSAHSQGVAIAGKNLANITNPAYARQRVRLADLGTINTQIGPQSMGLAATGIDSIRDHMLDSQLVRELSHTSLLATQQDNLNKAQALLGETVDRAGDSTAVGSATHSVTGVSSALNDFFNAFQELSANPSDAGAKQVLLQKAQILSGKLNQTDSGLAGLQGDISTQIGTDVGTVNGLLKDIGDLNNQIQKYEVLSPGAAVDLRDQRQAKLEELSKYMDVSAQEVPGQHGQIQITTHDSAGNPVVLLDKTNASSISFDGTNFSAGSPAVTLGLQGGSLKGQVDVRDGTIQQLRNNIQTTASQLAAAVNKAYNPTGTNGNFFKVPPDSGVIALDPTLNVSTLRATDGDDAGGNELALAVAQLATKKLSVANGDQIDGTISAYFAGGVSSFAASVAGVNDRYDDQSVLQDMIQTQRDAVSGVSQDEELTDLTKYQRAFQASSQVINIIDSMMDTVVNGLIR